MLLKEENSKLQFWFDKCIQQNLSQDTITKSKDTEDCRQGTSMGNQGTGDQFLTVFLNRNECSLMYKTSLLFPCVCKWSC